MAFQIFLDLKFDPAQAPVIPRPKPMKVLVLGLSRTGTMSMWQALGKLGLRSYHFLEVGRQSENRHVELWTKAIKAKYHGEGKPFEGSDFDQMLWNYDAVADAPCCLFVDELLAAYPEAKVILTTRSTTSWMSSMQRTFLEIVSWRSWVFLGYLDRYVSGSYFTLLEMCPRIWSNGLPPWQESSFPTMMRSFEEHNAYVKKVVPKDRLLVFHPSEGWGPICEFLDVQKPEEAFPHINDGDDVVRFHKLFYWGRWIHVVKTGVLWSAAIGALVSAAWWVRRTQM